MDGIGKVIFIGGIHGVGKTTFAEELSSLVSIKNFSSGKLIRSFLDEAETGKKVVKNVSRNQDVLISAIAQLDIDEDVLILDGHFCLLTSENQISRIPEKTFKNLNIASAMVIQEAPETIAVRLKNRDQRNYSPEDLQRFQDAELEYAREICGKFEIPFQTFGGDEVQSAAMFLSTNLKKL